MKMVGFGQQYGPPPAFSASKPVTSKAPVSPRFGGVIASCCAVGCGLPIALISGLIALIVTSVKKLIGGLKKGGQEGWQKLVSKKQPVPEPAQQAEGLNSFPTSLSRSV